MNSLEDTYVNIGLKEEELFGQANTGADSNQQRVINMSNEPPAAIKREPTYSFFAQFWVIFLRKFYFTFRSWRAIIMMSLPALFLVIAALISES